jgi:hypothetical protein
MEFQSNVSETVSASIISVDVSEMLDYISILTWLIAQEYFIAFSHHESFESYYLYVCIIEELVFMFINYLVTLNNIKINICIFVL